MLGPSDSWSMRRLTQQPSIQYRRLSNFNSTRKLGNYGMLIQNYFGPIVVRDLASSFLGSPRKSYTNYNLWTFFSRSLHTNSLRSYTMYVVNNFMKILKTLLRIKETDLNTAYYKTI